MDKKRAFIFDMDGVIIDSEPIHDKVVRGILAKDNIFVSDEEFRSYMGMASTAVFKLFIEKYNLAHTPQQLASEQMESVKDYIVKYNIKPIAGIVDLLQKLKEHDVPTAIASSSPMSSIEFVAKQFGIAEYFNLFVSGEDLPHSKPNPDIYLKTAKLLNVAPCDCVVLEDSKNGTIAGKSAGMYCIAFDNPNSGNQDLTRADIIVKNISDIDVEKYLVL